jgi:hypothetical protein
MTKVLVVEGVGSNGRERKAQVAWEEAEEGVGVGVANWAWCVPGACWADEGALG